MRRSVALVLFLAAATAAPARADNCSGLTDCWQNIALAAIAVAAIAAAIFIVLNPELLVPFGLAFEAEAGAAAEAGVAGAVEAGIPEEIAEALETINPSGGTMNCGFTSTYGASVIEGVPAFEAGLEGEVCGDGLADSTLEREFGSFFSDATPEAIDAQLSAGGDGAQGIIGVGRTEANGAFTGHFFNVANFDGNVFYLDFQSGSWYTSLEEAVADMGYANYNDLVFMPTGG